MQEIKNGIDRTHLKSNNENEVFIFFITILYKDYVQEP